MKNTKLGLFILLLLASCLIFSACNIAPYVYSVSGIENFRKEESNQSINQCLLPSNSFLTAFEYEEADYHYRDEYESFLLLSGCEQSFVRLRYNADNYQTAKDYCLDTMRLSDQNTFEYNGFTFIENIALHEGRDSLKDGKNIYYPHFFNILAYNDEKQELIFIGFFAAKAYHDETNIALTDWSAFLDRYYTEFYDFKEQ